MSLNDLRRLIQRASPRIEDVRSPDRTDIIRREHGHLPFREIVDALDALEFSAGSFMRCFRDLSTQEPEKDEHTGKILEDTAVHNLFNMLDGLRVLSPSIPIPTVVDPETEQEPVASEPGWQEVA
ncbi:unnamed protein product, partial [Polarella glacialis]